MRKTGTLLKQFYNHSRSIYPPTIGTWSTLAATFNSRPDRKLNLSLTKEDVGLFDVPQLRSYEGFYFLKDKCVGDADKLMDEAISENRSRKMVQVFDDLSDSLCRVADLAEFIRIAHPSISYKHAAEIASGAISGIVERLNTNNKLYSTLSDVIKNGDKVPTTKVDEHVGQLFLFDFEQSGIHLPKKDRDRVVMLNDSILHLGQRFVAGCTDPRIISKCEVPENIRHVFPIKGDEITVSGLCADSANPHAREAAYRIYLNPDGHQEFLLTEILKARSNLAQTCGFPTYAHRALKGSTIDTPEMVMEFLDTLSNGLKELAGKDFEVMRKMKESEFQFNQPLAAWDVPYFTKKIKQSLFNVENSDYSPYFSLGVCMDGLNNLLTKLYGISLIDVEMMPGEAWVPDVYKLAVTHETEGLLGYIYCDFYARSGKPNQDCHFTIQGGRILPDGSYQLPIVALMLNFPLPRWSTPTLLLPNMVDNLFHEMGHAMHSMLARTQYQHVTGTRCSTDLAEVPSILMEYFANDIRVLRTFARHFQTKEPMPEDMLQRLCASKHIFTASETQTQLFYSVLDQRYHTKHPLNEPTTEVLVQAHEQYYNLPYVPYTAWQLRFSHLIGYGAKYYAYLVSRALASCIWQSYFEDDPLNRTQGERYRRELLAYGGGKPPFQLVSDFLQKEPTTTLLVNSLLKDIDLKQTQVQKFTTKYL